MQKIAFAPALTSFVRPGNVRIDWVIDGHARKDAAALAKFDAAWDAAHAEYIVEGKTEWPEPPVCEVPFSLPFAPSTKGKRKHGKVRAVAPVIAKKGR